MSVNISIAGHHNKVNIILPRSEPTVNPTDDLIDRLQEHKVKSRKISSMLSDIYEKDNPRKAHNIKFCGSYIQLREYQNEARTKHIKAANFCRHPLCPMCAWRYSLKWAVWLFKACEQFRAEGRFLYHLILTRPNVEHLEAATLRHMRTARRDFFKAAFGSNLEAYAEAFEVTCKGRGFHPHQHIIVVLRRKFEISREIINDMEHLWRKFMPSKYDYTILNLWPIKGDPRDIAEVCKYIVSPDGKFTLDELREIDTALYQFKKVTCSGSMQEHIKSAKAATEAEKADIIKALEACGWKDYLLQWKADEARYNISLLP